MRLSDGPDALLVEIPDVLNIFGDSLASDGERVEVKSSRLLRQLLEQCGYAAGGVDVLDVPLPIPVPRRRHFREMRHAFGDIIEPRQWIFDPRFVRDGDDVEQGVGRATHRDIERYGVVDSIGGDDVAKADAAAQELEHLARGGAGELVPLG